MDKSWMTLPRASNLYLEGVNRFLEFAFSNVARGGEIICPCKDCNNCLWHNREVVLDHLVWSGFAIGYTCWIYHGEASSSNTFGNISQLQDDNNVEIDNMHGMLHESFRVSIPNHQVEEGTQEQEFGGRNDEYEKFCELMKDSEQELYPGCKKFSKLSFIVRFYHIKCLSGLSNKAFTMILEMFKEALPEGETLPNSFYETKKIIGDLGLDYKKIDACPNDCMLYWKERSKDSECAVCGTSRWKMNEDSNTKKKVPVKVVRHFPLKPRLQRLFMSSKTASSMQWHEKDRIKDGLLRHPADSLAWKTFDSLHPSFSSDPRNVRLGLASDGFNPFRTMSTSHSTWPVVLVPYNLPPWMCLKHTYFMMTLLIPGPKAPGNDIDVYLQPLIEELNDLWESGINTYDACNKNTFMMRAALMWTINDFPAYANLSGWSTRGKLACPSCNKKTWHKRLKNGKKFCFMGHRRFLSHNHRYRRNTHSFDGKPELDNAPPLLSGSEILEQLREVNVIFGKNHSGPITSSTEEGWKKRSIFFELPYWKTNLLRHNLDVMHIEKNVCESLLWTLLNINGKTKDNVKARLDLIDMNIRNPLHPIKRGGNKTYLPPACFTMSREEKRVLCQVLKDVKVPDGYASNISRCVNMKEKKLIGLKSHDCHILMQQLLPLALRRVLPKNVSSVLIELCKFFRELCSKAFQVDDFNELEKRVTLTLCQLEMIFPPAFFDVMVHLPIHLAGEAKLGGPVQYRWMYEHERFLGKLKSYVRNRSRPEGSIAEGYIAEECLTFCSRYLDGIETRFNRPSRNQSDDGDDDDEPQPTLSIFRQIGRKLGASNVTLLDSAEVTKAHQYVLFNCEAMEPYLELHLASIRMQRPRATQRDIEIQHHREFPSWFANHVDGLQQGETVDTSEEIRALARGPNNVVKSLSAFVVNGFRFHTRTRESNRKTQNSGVYVTAKTQSYSSSRDRNPIEGDVTYYGVLEDIIELEYFGSLKVVLFKCRWYNVLAMGRGIKKDEYGFTLVNSTLSLPTNEPYVLASQAQQVFYVDDPIEIDWRVVIKTSPRDFYDMFEEVCTNDVEPGYQNEPYSGEGVENNFNDVVWVRDDVRGIMIDTPLITTQGRQTNHGDDTFIDDRDENSGDEDIDREEDNEEIANRDHYHQQ